MQIVSGAPNVTFTAPNKFSLKMPTNFVSGGNDRISMKSLRLYYSWFNLTPAKNNNQFSYTWHDGSVHQVILQGGIWDYANFQGYFQTRMTDNGHYLTNSAGEKQFYIRFDSNPVFYRISLTVTPIPTALPSGWTAPAGFTFPATAITPLVTIPSTNIRNYLGFTEGTYPSVAQTTLYQVNSANIPQVTDVSSLMLQCNLVYNEYGPDMRTLASFNVEPGTTPGSTISEVPNYQDWLPVQSHIKPSFVTVSLVDQNSNPVKIEDPAGFICTLNIESSN